MSGSVQQEFDDLARRNSWQVDSRPGESVYTRGGETLILRFRDGGTAVTGASRTVPFDLSAKDWRGQVGNVLRRRWRTFEHSGGTPGEAAR
jgi:hypothetical protein